MEPKSSQELVDRMFAMGEVSLVDAETMYRYSLMAVCPKDGDYSYVDQFEKTGHALKSVTFKCPTCSALFTTERTQIMVI